MLASSTTNALTRRTVRRPGAEAGLIAHSIVRELVDALPIT